MKQHSLKMFLDNLDSEGGRYCVALTLFFAGIVLLLAHIEYGKEICIGASSALFTLLTNKKAGDHSVVMNDAQNVTLPEHKGA